MNDATKIALARIASGTAILIASMATGVNGTYQILAMLLLGLPVEALAKRAAET